MPHEIKPIMIDDRYALRYYLSGDDWFEPPGVAAAAPEHIFGMVAAMTDIKTGKTATELYGVVVVDNYYHYYVDMEPTDGHMLRPMCEIHGSEVVPWRNSILRLIKKLLQEQLADETVKSEYG
mgnify:CR=1 FL=1|jgi:hypothetical protein